MVVQSRAMAGLAFQCKIIMCSAVVHRAMASKGCSAETGTLSLPPQTVCGIAYSLLRWVPEGERRKLLLILWFSPVPVTITLTMWRLQLWLQLDETRFLCRNSVLHNYFLGQHVPPVLLGKKHTLSRSSVGSYLS